VAQFHQQSQEAQQVGQKSLDGHKGGLSAFDVERKEKIRQQPKRKSNTKSNLSTTTKYIQAAVVALAADDVTGIGVVDDVAIPVLEAINGALWLWDIMTRDVAPPSIPLTPPKYIVPPSQPPSTFINNTSPSDYSTTPPGNLTKLRNGQGWRDADGNVWKKDQLHKDHWDITNPKTGKKVKEIDFNGNQIWPNGPKNKNKE
jgi:hypothetical protein